MIRWTENFKFTEPAGFVPEFDELSTRRRPSPTTGDGSAQRGVPPRLQCRRRQEEAVAHSHEEGDMTENNDTANDEMRVIYVEVSRWLVLSLYADREAGRTVCLRAGGGSPYESKASWHDWVSGNAEGSVSRRRPSPCDYIRSSSRPSHTHRLLRSRRLPHSRTASWVSQGTSTDSRGSWSVCE